MREMLAAALVAAGLTAATAQAQEPAPLKGPAAAGHARVLVIGVDGTRWDLVKRAMAGGRAPSLSRLAREGVAGPTLLPYSPPSALTLSEVGWSTIASGVGPAKHGVTGVFLNNDPGQATKNGYADFLTRAESLRPATSTFLASDWANIGLHQNGGPIFGDGIDARWATAADDSVDSYNQGDAAVTAAASRYLRQGDPDAGFVYLGAMDETAHQIGSATQSYRDAIALADRRIGRLVDAVRSRPTYGLERWTVIVTTDHGQQDLDFPSMFSHGGPSELERTSFVFASGPGIPAGGSRVPGVVDIAPTVLHGLGLTVPASWNLDGHPFVTGAGPPARPAARIRLRTRQPALELAVDAAPGAPSLGAVRVALPRSLSLRPGVRGRIRLARHALRVSAATGARRIRVRVALLHRPGRATRSLPATVTEAGDVPLKRRIPVTRRR